jgi:hypothetical protein
MEVYDYSLWLIYYYYYSKDWYSNPWPQSLSRKDIWCLRPRGRCHLRSIMTKLYFLDLQECSNFLFVSVHRLVMPLAIQFNKTQTCPLNGCDVVHELKAINVSRKQLIFFHFKELHWISGWNKKQKTVEMRSWNKRQSKCVAETRDSWNAQLKQETVEMQQAAMSSIFNSISTD